MKNPQLATLFPFHPGYLQRLAIITVICLAVLTQANAGTYYSRMSGPWTTSATWSLTSGGAAIPSGYPGAGDNVVIEGGFTVTMAAAGAQQLYAANVFIGGSSTSGTLSYPIGNPPSSLTVTGDVTIGGSGASAAGTLSYGSWGLTITCARLLKGTGNATRSNDLQQDFTFTGTFTLPTGFNKFRNFIVDGGTVTLSENIETNGSVSPAITPGSTLDLQTYTIDIGGYQNFVINGTLIVGGNSGGVGNSNFPSNFENLTIGSASTVVYSYAGNQTIYPFAYNNLILSGSGIKSTGFVGFIASLTLTNGGSGYACDASISFIGGGGAGASGEAYTSGDAGDPIDYLSLDNGGSGYTSAPAVVINGYCGGAGATAIANMTIRTAATVNGTLSIGGAVTLSGTAIVYGAASKLAYTGSAAQTTGVEFPSTWSGSGGVLINNSNGVTLNSSKTISSSLTLTSGILTTTSSSLLTISNTSPSAISSGSAASYINGPVAVSLPSNLAAGSSYTLPVGKAGTYLPLVLVNPTTTTGSITATAEAFKANSGGTPDGSSILTIGKEQYWSLSTSGNFTGASISLTRPTALNGLNLVAKSTTANGVYSSLGGTVSGTSIINSNNTGAAANLYFVMASDAMLLPATMSAITASEQPGGIQVKWTILTETGINRYEVEKSTDGLHYHAAAGLPSKGNSRTAADYHWLDRDPVDGNNYYRIKIIGLDGDIKYSGVVKVVIARKATNLYIYPNPVKGNTIRLQLVNLEKGVYQVTISNQLGQPVFNKTIEHAGGSAVFTLQPGKALAVGLYQLGLSGNHLYETVPVLKN